LFALHLTSLTISDGLPCPCLHDFRLLFNDELSNKLVAHHVGYCAGWTIEDRASVATLALLFDKLTFIASEQRLLSMLELSPYAKNADTIFEDFDRLYSQAHPEATLEELIDGCAALLVYSWHVDKFQRRYAPLFGPVFDKTLYVHLDDPTRRPRARAVTGGNLGIKMQHLEHLLSQGALPIHELDRGQTTTQPAT
jgi:hypothetical protein